MTRLLQSVLLALCAGCCSCGVFSIKTPKPDRPHRPPVTKPAEGTERIVVFSHGWHTGIVVPASSLRRHPWTEDLEMNRSGYAEFGWGAEEFYRRRDVTVGMVVRGLLWPTAAVVHLERFPESPYAHYPTSQLVTLELPVQRVDALINELRLSFRTNSGGQLVKLGHGVEKDSTMYSSRLKYYYPETCNVWTARLLNAAGVDIRKSTRSPELMKSLRKSGKAVR